MTTRRCTVCGIENNGTNFHRGGVAKDGLHSKCKTCRNAADKVSRSKPEFRAKRYGMDVLEMNKMLSNGCMVCGSYQKLVIDHDHACCNKQNYSCGKCVRGVLCDRCNIGLSHFEDNVEKLEKAANYLRRNK